MSANLREVHSGEFVRADDFNRLIRHVKANTISSTIGLLMERSPSGLVLRAPRPQSATSRSPEASSLVFSLKLSVGEEEAETVSVYVPEKIAPFVRTAINSENAPTINEFFVSGEYERSGDWLDIGDLTGDIFAWLDPDSGSVRFTDDLSDVADGSVFLRIGEVSGSGAARTAVNSFLGVFSFAFAPDSAVPIEDKKFESLGFTAADAIQIHGFDGSSPDQMIAVETTGGLAGASGTLLEDGRAPKFDILVRFRSEDGKELTVKYLSKDVFAQILGAHEISVKDAEDKVQTIFVFHKKSDEEEEAEEADGGDGETSCEDEFPGNAGSGGPESEYEFPRDGEEPFPGKSEKCW